MCAGEGVGGSVSVGGWVWIGSVSGLFRVCVCCVMGQPRLPTRPDATLGGIRVAGRGQMRPTQPSTVVEDEMLFRIVDQSGRLSLSLDIDTAFGLQACVQRKSLPLCVWVGLVGWFRLLAGFGLGWVRVCVLCSGRRPEKVFTIVCVCARVGGLVSVGGSVWNGFALG